MTRTQSILPALALILVPGALQAQARPEPYRTPYMEVALPAGFAAPVQSETETNGFRITSHIAQGKRGSIALIELPLHGSLVADTTVAARRAALEQVRAGIFGASRARPIGESTEIVTDDRVGVRTRAVSPGDGETYSLLEAFLPRRGPVVVMVAGFTATEKGAELGPEVRRFLDSIRIRPELLGEAITPPDSAGLARWIVGRWAWTAGTAADNPFTLSWSADGRSLELVYSRPLPVDSAGNTRTTFTYRDASVRPGYVRGTIDDERRTDDQGRPVSWDFVWLGENRFCWRRGDWEPGNCTAPVVRVPD